MAKKQEQKMTNREMIELVQAIREIETKAEGGIKFKFALAKNAGKCQSEINALSKAVEIKHEKLADYRKEISEAAKGDKETVQERVKAVQDKYPDVMLAIEQQRKDEQRILDEPCEVEFHKIDIKEVPQTVTAAQLRALFPMLTGEL